MCDSYRQCVKATDADGNLANLFWELTLRLLKEFFLGTETDMVKQQQKHSLWPFIVAEHFSLPISEPGKNSYDGPCM